MAGDARAMLALTEGARARVPGLWALGQVLRRDPEARPRALPDPSEVIPSGLTLDGLKDHDVAAAYRRLSWSVGIDPTKNRPSGEALARRILGQGSVPSIHPLVDAYNRASARTLVPLGAYDLAHLARPLTVREATTEDVFHGIGRDAEPLAPERIAYVAADGVVASVFLWRDSMETRIRPETREALVLAVGGDPLSPEVGHEALAAAVAYADAVGYRAAGGVVEATVIPTPRRSAP